MPSCNISIEAAGTSLISFRSINVAQTSLVTNCTARQRLGSAVVSVAFSISQGLADSDVQKTEVVWFPEESLYWVTVRSEVSKRKLNRERSIQAPETETEALRTTVRQG